jgi:hypothetical protein
MFWSSSFENKHLNTFLANEKPSKYVFVIKYFFLSRFRFMLISFYKAYNENKVKNKIIAGTANAKLKV